MSNLACYTVCMKNKESEREETFTWGPFEVTVHPATNEEDEWVEVEESWKNFLTFWQNLDGTLIREERGSDRLFDFLKPHAILNLTEDDLTPLGVLVRDSGKEFDILTARGPENAQFIRIALEALGFNVGRIVTVGVDVNEPKDWAKVSSKNVARKKIRIAKFVQRKLVDNDARNLVGLGELGELVNQEQTEF